MTRGAKGALLFMDGQIFQHPGFKVQAVDTVGAGDAFLAALLAQLHETESPLKALEFACATGAFVASHTGAVPGYTTDEIRKLTG